MSASCSDPRDPDNPTGTGRFLSQLDFGTGEKCKQRQLAVGEELLMISAVPIVNAKTFTSGCDVTQARERSVAEICDQLFGGNSVGVFCFPVPNSKILRSTPGAIAEIGLTRSTGWPGVPTIS